MNAHWQASTVAAAWKNIASNYQTFLMAWWGNHRDMNARYRPQQLPRHKRTLLEMTVQEMVHDSCCMTYHYFSVTVTRQESCRDVLNISWLALTWQMPWQHTTVALTWHNLDGWVFHKQLLRHATWHNLTTFMAGQDSCRKGTKHFPWYVWSLTWNDETLSVTYMTVDANWQNSLTTTHQSSWTSSGVPEFSWELISAEGNSSRAEEEFPVAKPPDRQQRWMHEGKEEDISGHWGKVSFITPIHMIGIHRNSWVSS